MRLYRHDLRSKPKPHVHVDSYLAPPVSLERVEIRRFGWFCLGFACGAAVIGGLCIVITWSVCG